MRLSVILFIWASATTALTLLSCSQDETSDGTGHNDAYFASTASVSSSSSNFSPTDGGGTIVFGTEGGTVAVNVDCGTEWIVQNQASDLFTVTADTSTGNVTITAEQNTTGEELTSAIVFYTAQEWIEFATITTVQHAYGVPYIILEYDEWNAPAFGELTKDIAIECNTDDYCADASADWLTAVKTESGLKLTAARNDGMEGRKAFVTVSASDEIRSVSQVIRVVQDPTVYLTVNCEEEIGVSSLKQSVSFTFESNFEVIPSCSANWLSFDTKGNTLTLTVDDNLSDDGREEVVALTAGDGLENVAEIRLSVTQSGVNALQLVYEIVEENTLVTLPLYGNVDCAVDWGDGSESEIVTSAYPSHTYAAAGEYCVSIVGTVTALNSYEGVASLASRNTTLTAVRQWGKTGLTTMENAFYCCSNLASLPADNCESFADVTSFEQAFYPCYALETLPAGLFTSCRKVTTFKNCFMDCFRLKKIPEGLFDNCPNVECFEQTFEFCEALMSVPAGLFANCPNVTTFRLTFYYNALITTIPERFFHGCTKVESFEQVFGDCSALRSLPDDLFKGCSEVTSFKGAFYRTAIQYVPEGMFDDCTKVTSFYYTFEECSNLVSVPTNLFDNNKKVTNFAETFCLCTNLTGEVPYTVVNDRKVYIYERSATLGFSKPSRHEACFMSCTGLDGYDDIPEEWKNF